MCAISLNSVISVMNIDSIVSYMSMSIVNHITSRLVLISPVYHCELLANMPTYVATEENTNCYEPIFIESRHLVVTRHCNDGEPRTG